MQNDLRLWNSTNTKANKTSKNKQPDEVGRESAEKAVAESEQRTQYHFLKMIEK